MFRPEVQQYKTISIWGPPSVLPPLIVSEKKQVKYMQAFWREYMQRGIKAMDYTRMQKCLHPLPYSSEEGISGLTQWVSCPSPPAAGTPCSVCHQSAFASRAPDFCSVHVQWRIERCEPRASGLGLLLQVLLKHVYPLISSSPPQLPAKCC